MYQSLRGLLGALKDVGERAGDHREGRGQGGALGGHLRQQVRVQAHAVLERIDPASTAAAPPAACWECTAIRPPTAWTAATTSRRTSAGSGSSRAASRRSPWPSRSAWLARRRFPVALCGRPADPSRRRTGRAGRSTARRGPPAGHPGPGRTRLAVPGQARRPDHRDARGHVLPQVLPQHGLVQRLAWSLRTRVGVAVNQTGQQPALGHQFGVGHRIGGPPVPVGIEVDRTPIGQGDTANPENGRRAAPGWLMRRGSTRRRS